MAYCMAMVLMFIKVFRMDGIGSLNLSSSSFIKGICVAALTPAVITMSGSIFQPRAAMSSISGLYLLALASSVAGFNHITLYDGLCQKLLCLIVFQLHMSWNIMMPMLCTRSLQEVRLCPVWKPPRDIYTELVQLLIELLTNTNETLLPL